MGRRSRSKSPFGSRRRDRDRERDKERDRDRDRDKDKERHRRKRSRDRSRERERRRYSAERDDHRKYSRSSSRSRSRSPVDRRRKNKIPDRPLVTAADLEGKSAEEQEMMKLMGFCNFDSTKGKKVNGNDVGEVHVILKRKYRQYMNRKGGFNRPLDFVA